MSFEISGYFASGSNRVGEIRGIAAAGRALGVAAPEVSDAPEAELHALAGSDLPVFVDSGAFGEVEFNAIHQCGVGSNGKPRKPPKTCREGKCIGDGNRPHPDHPPFTFVTVKPIGDDQWDSILGLYVRLARSLGHAVYLVAPDKVGDQSVTLDRLARYSKQVRQLRKLGANIIVPIQRGDLSAAQFDAKCAAALGFDDYIRGIPSKKGASNPADVAEFCADMRARGHYRVQLEGMTVTCDSVRLTAITPAGRTLHVEKRRVARERGLPTPSRTNHMPPDAYTEAVRRVFTAEGSRWKKAPASRAMARAARRMS
jgi:hypothetical protein